MNEPLIELANLLRERRCACVGIWWNRREGLKSEDERSRAEDATQHFAVRQDWFDSWLRTMREHERPQRRRVCDAGKRQATILRDAGTGGSPILRRLANEVENASRALVFPADRSRGESVDVVESERLAPGVVLCAGSAERRCGESHRRRPLDEGGGGGARPRTTPKATPRQGG